MSTNPCDVCILFDRICNLDCGVGILDPALADCQFDFLDCPSSDICVIENNCILDEVCNEECGTGILTVCDEDITDCESFGSIRRLTIGTIICITFSALSVIVCLCTVLVFVSKYKKSKEEQKIVHNKNPYIPPEGVSDTVDAWGS